MKRSFLQKSLPFLAFLVMFLLVSCSRRSDTLSYPIAGIWSVTVEDGDANWDEASILALEQNTGFALANEELAFNVPAFDFYFTPTFQLWGGRA